MQTQKYAPNYDGYLPCSDAAKTQSGGGDNNKSSTNEPLFSLLNYEDRSTNSCSSLPQDMCFFDTSNCFGEVINGICETHSGFLCRRIQSTIISARNSLWPVSTKSFVPGFPVKLFPVLSMAASTCPDYTLTHDVASVKLEGEDVLNKGKLPMSVENKQVSRKFQAFQEAYNAYILRSLPHISQRDITVTFTSGWKPNYGSEFANALYKKAKENQSADQSGESTVAIVNLSMFKNILDLLNIMSFLPGQISLSPNNRIGFVPNVYIIDGWFTYGFGFGVPKFLKGEDTDYTDFELHSISAALQKRYTQNIIPIIHPLVIDGSAPWPGTMYLIKESVRTVRQIPIQLDSNHKDKLQGMFD